MIPNLPYPTLFASVAMLCFAAWVVASPVRKRYRAPRIELATEMPEVDDTLDERHSTYSANHHEWSDSGASTDTSFSFQDTEAPSPANRRLCPRCGSDHIEKRNQARKAGSTIGAVAGATSGVAMTLSGAEVGATVGLIAGPIGSVFGGLAGAILAGLAASAAGCAAGAAMGEVIDENILDNHRCVACGHTFNASI